MFWVEPKERYPIEFIEGPQTFWLDDIEINLFPVVHVKWYQSIGIKINYQNKTLVYTGDIGGQHPLDKLKQIIGGVDLLLIEAGYIEPTPNHFTIDQIIKLTKEASVKKVIATHLRDVNVPILEKKIKNEKRIILARDLMRVII